MAKKFGKLVDGILELAPKCGKIGNVMYSSFTEEQYREMDYKEVVDSQLDPMDGYSVEFDGYDETDTTIALKYKYVEEEIQPYELSKIYLKIFLLKLGMWDEFEQWLKDTPIQLSETASITCYDAWNDALVLDVNSEMFSPYIQLAKEHFKDYLTDEVIQQILTTCKAK